MHPPSDLPSASTLPTRRRFLRTLFCSSVFLSLNLHRGLLRAADLAATTTPDDLHFIAVGDFGSMLPEQTTVAKGMQAYVSRLKLRPEALLLLGDNFYKEMPGGLQSPRWRTGFEEMYPAEFFPGPCPAVLGNHDYGDNVNGDAVQLAYAKQGHTRWTMPAKWYRMDWPSANPLVTFLFIDTNLPAVRGVDKDPGKSHAALPAADEEKQWAWLDAEFKKPRAPWTIVVGHHPVYSNGHHGDTQDLIAKLAPRLQANRIPLYLCGHDHDMQHLELDGHSTSFVLSGGGGAKIRPLEGSHPREYGKDIYGFSHLQINPSRILVRHLDHEGHQLHAFTKSPEGQFHLI